MCYERESFYHNANSYPPISTMDQSRLQRALSLLSYIQSGPRYNASDLAREFNVCRRTIYRDLLVLRQIGISIEFDEQNAGYYVPPVSHTTASAKLPQRELAALLLAARLSHLHRLPEIGRLVEQATTQLLGTTNVGTRNQISHLLNACQCEQESSPPNPDVEVLQLLLEAVQLQRQVRLTLHVPNAKIISTPSPTIPPGTSKKNESTRQPSASKTQNRQHKTGHQNTTDKKANAGRQTKVAPYKIVVKLGHWHLVGRSSVDRKTCSFALKDIFRVEITEDPFSLPRGYRTRTSLLVTPTE